MKLIKYILFFFIILSYFKFSNYLFERKYLHLVLVDLVQMLMGMSLMISLQSWASFEPTKTTVKRVLLQESQKTSANKSSLLINKQHFDSLMLDRSAAVTYPEDQTSPSNFLYPFVNKGEP